MPWASVVLPQRLVIETTETVVVTAPVIIATDHTPDHHQTHAVAIVAVPVIRASNAWYKLLEPP